MIYNCKYANCLDLCFCKFDKIMLRKVSCFEIDKHRFETSFNNIYPQRWKFIKEDKNVRKQEKTLSAKKTIKIKRKNRKKHTLDHESDQEKTITVK